MSADLCWTALLSDDPKVRAEAERRRADIEREILRDLLTLYGENDDDTDEGDTP